MEQRRLRPGDRLDDYCPRERRLTDHVVVAVVDDTIKQTRCVACDTEHPFKDGKVPLRKKKKETTEALVQEVLEGITDDVVAETDSPQPNLVMRPERRPTKSRRVAAASSAPSTPSAPVPIQSLAPPPPPSEPVAPEPPPFDAVREGGEDDGPVHRRLIRATLPRPEGQPPGRPAPEFTVRQPGTRGFPRGGAAPRFGFKAGGDQQRFGGGAWNGKQNGHGGHRPGAAAPGQAADARGRQKTRSRGARPHQKKAR
jgi:hypothetical protein